MAYKTPWGEVRPSRKELTAGTRSAYLLAGVDPDKLKQPLEEGDRVTCWKGEGKVVKLIGTLSCNIILDSGEELTVPRARLTRLNLKEETP